jgi:hypothetical protein
VLPGVGVFTAPDEAFQAGVVVSVSGGIEDQLGVSGGDIHVSTGEVMVMVQDFSSSAQGVIDQAKIISQNLHVGSGELAAGGYVDECTRYRELLDSFKTNDGRLVQRVTQYYRVLIQVA